MNDLVLQKRSLERKKNIANSISNIHIWVPSVGSFILFSSINNKTLMLIGGGILLYGLCFLACVTHPLESYITKTEEEVRGINKSIKKRHKVHDSLDNLRNSMLFDEDPKYWEVIQKLDPQGFPHE